LTVKRFPVEAGHVMMFARAIGDPNPVYTDPECAAATELGGVIAPPTFVEASAHFDPDYPLRPRLGEPWFGSGLQPSGGATAAGGTGFHAEQRYEYHRPVRVGDVLSIRTSPGRTWEKVGRRGGRLTFTETITEYRDEQGELVVTATSISIRTERPVHREAD
jgi:acyl dehydratase